MTPTPNAVERCKAVPITDRWPNGWGSCSNLVDTAIMWEAIDLLVADSARMRDAIRHFHNDPDTSPTPCECEWCKETR